MQVAGSEVLGVIVILVLAAGLAYWLSQQQSAFTSGSNQLADLTSANQQSANRWADKLDRAFAILRSSMKKNKRLRKVARVVVERVAGRKVSKNRRYIRSRLLKTRDLLVSGVAARDPAAYSTATWLLTRLGISVPDF